MFGIISILKVLSQASQTSVIFTMSVNLAVLRIAIVVRIPVSGNRILRTNGNQALELQILCRVMSWVSWNLPTNEATGHHPTVECKQTMGSQNAYIVHCGLHALKVTNLNVVASNLLRTCFKSQYLPNSIIFITERHLHMFLTLCSQLRFTTLR